MSDGCLKILGKVSKSSEGGGVYQFFALKEPDDDPPIFGLSHLDPPKMQVLSVHHPQIDFAGEIFERNIL